MPPVVKSVAGVDMAAVSAGIKKPGRLDVVLFRLCDGATVAGVYTQNAFRAAPVTVAMQNSQRARPTFFLINTGNANAGTGEAGIADALACCQALADHTGISPEAVLPFSTGVIGQKLPVDKIKAVLPDALKQLGPDGWEEAAKGIMTTDTRPKGASKSLVLDGKSITVTGIAKGAGMIKPNMATMLGFIFTDAAVDQSVLDGLVKKMAAKSFNRITVDGDTSTNDCCMLAATGQSGLNISELDADGLKQFESALESVFLELAQSIIRDAEGATKFVSIRVEEGKNSEECLRLAYAVAESPLVKTALFASDPNWGRILAAAGRAGLENLDVNRLRIWLGDTCIVENGGVCETYTEAAGQAVMNKPEISILLNLGRGTASEEVWTCDLSQDYVKINAEYRS